VTQQKDGVPMVDNVLYAILPGIQIWPFNDL